MSFGQAIQHVFKNYAQFRGTAPRSEYWWWVLFTAAVGLILGFLDGQMSDGGDTGVLTGLWAIATAIPTLAVTVRRLRDGGFHWALMLLLVIPFFGALVVLVLTIMPTKNTLPLL